MINFDTTTVILLAATVVLGIAYFAKRNARIRRERDRKRRAKSRL